MQVQSRAGLRAAKCDGTVLRAAAFSRYTDAIKSIVILNVTRPA